MFYSKSLRLSTKTLFNMFSSHQANVVLFVILLRVIFGKLASRYGKEKLEIAK